MRQEYKKSLDLLHSYTWPGNIRELQNVIERSVIVSEAQTFSVDESWLSRPAPSSGVDIRPNLLSGVPTQEEKAVIETALRECGGRVYGPSGAAARLGIPRTTLESKIKSLKINKHRFQRDRRLNSPTSSIDEFVNRRFSSFAIYLFSITCGGSRLALSYAVAPRFRKVALGSTAALRAASECRHHSYGIPPTLNLSYVTSRISENHNASQPCELRETLSGVRWQFARQM